MVQNLPENLHDSEPRVSATSLRGLPLAGEEAAPSNRGLFRAPKAPSGIPLLGEFKDALELELTHVGDGELLKLSFGKHTF